MEQLFTPDGFGEYVLASFGICLGFLILLAAHSVYMVRARRQELKNLEDRQYPAKTRESRDHH